MLISAVNGIIKQIKLMRKTFYSRVILLSVLLFALTLLGGAWAASLPYIDRSKVRIFIKPGQKYFGELFVENPTAEGRSMIVYLEDWYYLPENDGSKEFVPAGSRQNSCTNWMNFSPAELRIPAFGKQRISYSIDVPAGASGGYYTAMFFETSVAKLSENVSSDERGAGIDLKVRIATLFYVEAEGTVNTQVDIGNLSVEKDFSTGGLVLGVDFENRGNVDVTAGGDFYIIDGQGMIFARGELNDLYTFPGDQAQISGRWKDSVPSGRYDLVINLDLDRSKGEGGRKTPLITKEAEIEIGRNTEVLRVGPLR